MSKSPNVSYAADVVLFAPRDNELHVLLVQRGHEPFKDCWAFPGGYVDDGENSEEAAHRELDEETGLRVPRLRRVDVYDVPGRDPRGPVVSVAYTALLTDAPEPTAGDDAAAARWVPVKPLLMGMEQLAFDHAAILNDAAAQAGLTLVHFNRDQLDSNSSSSN